MSSSYVKQGFKDGQILHAEHLIKMEEGIIEAQNNTGEVVSVNSDWDVNDPTDPAYMKNRPFYTESSGEIKQLDEKYIPDSIARVSDIKVEGDGGVIPDLSINDPTDPAYVKNRTHYTEEGLEIEVDLENGTDNRVIGTVAGMGDFVRVHDDIPNERFRGAQYTLVFYVDGELQREQTYTISEETYDQYAQYNNYVNDDYAWLAPHLIVVHKDNYSFTLDTDNNYIASFPKAGVYVVYSSQESNGTSQLITVTNFKSPERVKQIDPKYIPQVEHDIIGKSGSGENAEIFNDSGNIASGVGSHAEGIKTRANGNYSHAEGASTTAIGYFSHTEGQGTTTIGLASHAEGGVTLAIGDQSHTEGAGTVAIGHYSHAEGGGVVDIVYISGDAGSHVYNIEKIQIYNGSVNVGDIVYYEGVYAKVISVDNDMMTFTVDKTLSSDAIIYSDDAPSALVHHSGFAIGIASHSEGYCTIAAGDYQHVQGRNNIEDSENKYAHIVGNGETGAPSNAHTVDWEGNGWFAGNIHIGGSGQNDSNALFDLYSNKINDRYIPDKFYSKSEVDQLLANLKSEILATINS